MVEKYTRPSIYSLGKEKRQQRGAFVNVHLAFAGPNFAGA
jgi:hypothetical protein